MNQTFYLLVAGSRNYANYSEFCKVMDCVLSYHIQQHHDIVIVSGGARGTDSLAEKYAREKNFNKYIICAEWNLYGKQAGYIRNRQMHQYLCRQGNMPRGCLCFWSIEEQSKGTRQNFTLCKEHNTFLKVFDFRQHRFLREEEIPL